MICEMINTFRRWLTNRKCILCWFKFDFLNKYIYTSEIFNCTRKWTKIQANKRGSVKCPFSSPFFFLIQSAWFGIPLIITKLMVICYYLFSRSAWWQTMYFEKEEKRTGWLIDLQFLIWILILILIFKGHGQLFYNLANFEYSTISYWTVAFIDYVPNVFINLKFLLHICGTINSFKSFLIL